jgi:anti-anti-sigma factor
VRSGFAEVGLALHVSIRESGDVAIVDLRGRVTFGPDSDLLRTHLKELIDHDVRKLLLNLADLTQVDSSGVNAIIDAHTSLQRQGGTVKLLRPNGSVLALLRVIHLIDVIPTFEDETQALASFRAQSSSATS